MFGTSRNGFTWKKVADVLHVPESSIASIFGREIRRQKNGGVKAKRRLAGARDQRRSSNPAHLRQRAASSQRLECCSSVINASEDWAPRVPNPGDARQ
jgi:hypothetical protein